MATSPWRDRRILELFGVEHPIVQAPMAGSNGVDLVVAVCEAGGLGSLPCAMRSPDEARREVAEIRARTARPFNLNFFCHAAPEPDGAREAAWLARLVPYYAELGVDPREAAAAGPAREPFGEAHCALVEETRPAVVSFHFGLPAATLVARVKAAGAVVIASATSVAEARWLEARGCDAIVAQGLEAGGHRGVFLTTDVARQVGTMALVPQIADAVRVPVIAAGGVGDARGVVAALALGAAAVQLGTAYLFCPEATVSAAHARALREAADDATALTNVITGRPARGVVNRLVREVGPIAAEAPAFPRANLAIAPLRAAAERAGSRDFSPLWAGQASPLGLARADEPAGELTRRLAREALALAARLAGVAS